MKAAAINHVLLGPHLGNNRGSWTSGDSGRLGRALVAGAGYVKMLQKALEAVAHLVELVLEAALVHCRPDGGGGPGRCLPQRVGEGAWRPPPGLAVS